MAKAKKHGPEQIVNILRQIGKNLAPRRAEAKAAQAPVAERWIVCQASSGATESPDSLPSHQSFLRVSSGGAMVPSSRLRICASGWRIQGQGRCISNRDRPRRLATAKASTQSSEMSF